MYKLQPSVPLFFQFLQQNNSKVLGENARNIKETANSKPVAKQNDKKVVVPVEQFEAFKVYEDEEQLQWKQKPPRLPKPAKNDPYIVYKEQIGNRLITKKELAEMERKLKPKEPSPMSVEKCENWPEKVENEIVLASRSSKDIFFEVEEYRSTIYQYLREHEVSFLGW